MKRIVFGCVFCFLAVLGRAQVPFEDALLWEITGNGMPQPSYLFGTIHLICPADFSLGDSLQAAISRTRQVALEMDMDDPNMMTSMAKTMYMTDGKSLKGLMSDVEYSKLDKFYKDSVGMGIAPFERAKPFVLMGPLFNVVLSCQPQSYEMALVGLAAKQQSEVIGLETIEEQMAIFDSIPYRDQVKMIFSMIDSLPKAREEFKGLVNLYKQQKINDLYKLTLKSEFDMDGNEELLLSARNLKWIPRMRRIMHEKSTFFAVGAAHLGGEKGVIALLRKDGFVVRPVKN